MNKLITLRNDVFYIRRSLKNNRLYLIVTVYDNHFYFKVDFLGTKKIEEEIHAQFEVKYYKDSTMTKDAILHSGIVSIMEDSRCINLVAPFQSQSMSLFGYQIFVKKIITNDTIQLKIVQLHPNQENGIFRGELFERFKCAVHDEDLAVNNR